MKEKMIEYLGEEYSKQGEQQERGPWAGGVMHGLPEQ